MEIEKTPIADLILIKPRVFPDSRGYFFESYNQKRFDEHNLNMSFVQDNLSKSEKGVLRGLHFQNPPFSQGKLVYVIKGAVLDVAVDLRKNSATYGQHYKVELSEENHLQLYVPEGFAHGFLTLRDDTIFTYKCTNYYEQPSEESILWNDDDLGIDWGISDPKVSEKDQNAQTFRAFKSPF
jgi:dTDP-4-dehydrorhamnose 3,5-epimerase